MATARKLALITGGNTGIGKDAAAQLLAKGTHDVVIACRDQTKGNVAIAELRAQLKQGGPTASLMELDLASFASIRAFAAKFKSQYKHLDLLIANAGLGDLMAATKVPRKTADGLELTVGTNHFGHFLLVGELLPLLKGDGRVVLTSSMLHYKGIIDKADPQLLVKEGAYNGDAAYNNSKLYNVLMAMELNKRYAGVGITANAMHPGFIPVSDFLRNLGGATRFLMTAVIYPLGRVFGFTSSVAAGAASELVAAESAESGLYFDRLRGPRAPSKLVTAENQEWLWRLSEQVTGCIYPTLQ